VLTDLSRTKQPSQYAQPARAQPQRSDQGPSFGIAATTISGCLGLSHQRCLAHGQHEAGEQCSKLGRFCLQGTGRRAARLACKNACLLSYGPQKKLCLTYLAALPDLKGSPGKGSSAACGNMCSHITMIVTQKRRVHFNTIPENSVSSPP